ncbi:MAG: hypothetical protein ACR2ML_04275, partial [Solirubrobacteraceae bacterium]
LLEGLGEGNVEHGLLEDVLVPQRPIGRSGLDAEAKFIWTDQEYNEEEYRAGSKQPDGCRGYLRKAIRVGTVEHGLSQQRGDDASACEQGRSTTSDFGDLALLLAKRIGPELV